MAKRIQMEELSHLDLAFCVDLTSSMTPFIHSARQQMVAILKSLCEASEASLQVGVCGYRDHSEEADTTECYPFTGDTSSVQRVLENLQVFSPADNKDAAEAVLAGLVECLKLQWRPHAYRVVILVGDAPPHGCGAVHGPFPDRWPDRDPTGMSVEDITARMESEAITLFTLSMSPSVIPAHDPVMLEAFKKLASFTGGVHHDASNANAAMQLFEELSRRAFSNLDVDRAVWEHYFKLSQEPGFSMACAPAPEAVAMELGVSAAAVRKARKSLSQRKIGLPTERQCD